MTVAELVESVKRDHPRNKESCKLIRQLYEIADFVRKVGAEARFGDLSRAPLQLLRFELCGDMAECDWIARRPDEWDSSLEPRIGEIHASTQALSDALRVRNLLFRVFPGVCTAIVRVYRQLLDGRRELIITGTVRREQCAPAAVRSLAMRAKLYGLQFWLDEGILENMQVEEYAINS